METIWKFELNERLEHANVPKGFKVLTTAIQGNKPVVWLQVNPNQTETLPIKLKAVATGEVNVNANDLYIGTVMFMNGAIVEHIYLSLQ